MSTLSDSDKQLEMMYNVTTTIGTVKQYLQEHDVLDLFTILTFRGSKLTSDCIGMTKSHTSVWEEQVLQSVTFINHYDKDDDIENL
eukprot:6900066-Ditylum_brightwellii.AAC.1